MNDYLRSKSRNRSVCRGNVAYIVSGWCYRNNRQSQSGSRTSVVGARPSTIRGKTGKTDCAKCPRASRAGDDIENIADHGHEARSQGNLKSPIEGSGAYDGNLIMATPGVSAIESDLGARTYSLAQRPDIHYCDAVDARGENTTLADRTLNGSRA